MRFHKQTSAFKSYVESYFANVSGDYTDAMLLLNKTKQNIFNILCNNSLSLRLRFIICLTITFMKFKDESPVFKDFYFCSFAERLTSAFQINEKIENAFQKTENSVETFIREGSGWIIKRIKTVRLHIGKYNSLSGGCYSIKLPVFLQNKKCLLTIKCQDNLCFLYCILAGLFPTISNKNAPSSYKKYLKYLNIKNVAFPMTIDKLKYFEERNNLSLNVYSYDKEIFPIHISKRKYINTLIFCCTRTTFFL